MMVLSLFAFLIYYINSFLIDYKNSISDVYVKFNDLEKEKETLDRYNKVLSKGSKESANIRRHILSDNRKDILNLINELENYTKKVGLSTSENSAIVSVSKRENANLSKYKAGDLVMNISVYGEESKINDFFRLLNNLPFISYIEKIDMKYDPINNKNNANIVLIIYQRDENK